MVGTDRRTRVLKLLAALLLMFVPIIGGVSQVGAQGTGLVDDSTYVFDMNDDELTWGGDWTFSPEISVSDPVYESVFLNTDAGIFATVYLDGVDDTAVAADAFLESFAGEDGEIINVDEGDIGSGIYSLNVLETESGEFAIFLVSDDSDGTSRTFASVSGVDTLGSIVDLVLESVEVNGDSVYDGIESVDGDGVTLASSSSGDDGTDEPTEEAGEEAPDGSEAGLGDDNTYVMDFSGAEISWGDPWVFDDSLNNVEADYESVGFVGGTAIQSILYLPSGVDLDDSRDAFLEGFASDDVAIQQVDRGAYDNVSYSLDLAEIGGTLFGLFTVYIDNGEYVRSFATLAPERGLGDAVDLAADTITIDGEPIYTGVAGSGLQDLVDASADSFTPTDTVEGDADDETPEPTEEVDEETPEATEEDEEETPEATEDDEETEEATEEDEEETPEATEEDEEEVVDGDEISDDLIDAGIVSSTEYESPQFGFSIEWDDNWRIWEELDAGGATSDTRSEEDSLALYWVDSDAGDGFGSITFLSVPADGATVDDYVEFWTSDDFLSDSYSEDVELIDSDGTDTEGAVVVLDVLENSDLYIYRGVVLVDDGETAIIYTLITETAVAADVWADGSDAIEIDGEPILTLIEIEDDEATSDDDLGTFD